MPPTVLVPAAHARSPNVLKATILAVLVLQPNASLTQPRPAVRFLQLRPKTARLQATLQTAIATKKVHVLLQAANLVSTSPGHPALRIQPPPAAQHHRTAKS